MSIKIVPQETLEQQKENNSIVGKIPLLFYPAPKILYKRRHARLIELAKESPFSDYLQFCAAIVEQQNHLVQENPIIKDLQDVIKNAAEYQLPPLSLENYPLTEKWIEYLYPILDVVESVNEQIDRVIVELRAYSKEELMLQATKLLSGDFKEINNNQSLFLWSALSVYYVQLASQIKGKALEGFGEHRWLCPVCKCSPTASIVHLGANAGLRYLHCGLCETEWHVPRVKCTNCDSLDELTYYSLDNEKSAVKTECCDHCHSYLKIFNQDHDPYVEIVADDVASLVLDMETEKEGYAKSGINPLLFSKNE